MEIRVSKHVDNGLTETNGLLLRKAINDKLENIEEDDVIVLNFEDIDLFATPFFNSSIGYFVTFLGKEKFDKTFKLDNISDLGMNTYQLSYDNAVERYNKEKDEEKIGKITKNNIEES